MEIHTLSQHYSVTSQIHPHDVERFAKLGFKTIINNRPEGESEDQPLGADLAEACRTHGVTYEEIPFAPNGMTMAHIESLRTIMLETTLPVLAFCKTGGRASMLWNSMQEHLASNQAEGEDA